MDGAPSEVWIFLVAGGSAVPCWFFFDLNKNAIVISGGVSGRSQRSGCESRGQNQPAADGRCGLVPSSDVHPHVSRRYEVGRRGVVAIARRGMEDRGCVVFL